MRPPVRTQNLGRARALILHRPHGTVQALTRQLDAIGLVVTQSWPEAGAGALGADFVFFDADMGYDDQFPWEPGQGPMPMIALIGSEAPGRVEWALRVGAHAQLLKPVGDNGAYAALLTARAAFDAQQSRAAEIATLRRRLDERRTVARAVGMLARTGLDDDAAYDRLQRMAMDWRIDIEGAAARVVARLDGSDPTHDDTTTHGRTRGRRA